MGSTSRFMVWIMAMPGFLHKKHCRAKTLSQYRQKRVEGWRMHLIGLIAADVLFSTTDS
jgi:hypothetical protein